MGFNVTRRTFIGSLGVAAAATVASSIPAHAIFEPMLHSPFDLAYDKATSAASSEIRIGYAAITWGDKERQAIDDISSLGYRGIQLRANAIRDFQPAELRDVLSNTSSLWWHFPAAMCISIQHWRRKILPCTLRMQSSYTMQGGSIFRCLTRSPKAMPLRPRITSSWAA